MRNAFILTPENHIHSSSNEYYPEFIKNLRDIGRGSKSDKVKAAIKLTAETLHISPEFVARCLVEIGVRAPKSAFPRNFVAFINGRKDKSIWEQDSLTTAQRDLLNSW